MFVFFKMAKVFVYSDNSIVEAKLEVKSQQAGLTCKSK
jgi:hypothetical protein